MILFLIKKLFIEEENSTQDVIDSLKKRDWVNFDKDILKVKNLSLKNLLLALKAYQQQNFIQAQDFLKPLIADKKYLPSALLVLGFLHDEQHMYDLAIKAFDKYIELKPDEYDVSIFICELLIKVKQKEKAHQYLVKTLDSPNIDLTTCASCTKYFLHLRDEANAYKAFYKAFFITSPTMEEIKILLNSVVKAGAYKMADKLFEYLHEKRFESKGELPRYYGDTYYERKLYDKAIDLYKLMLQTNKHDAKTYNNLGLCFLEKKDYSQAIDYFKKSIKFNALDEDTYNNLAIAYAEIPNYPKAIQSALQSIEIKPTIQAYSTLSQDYYRTREFDLAQITNEKALELDPYNQNIHWNQSLVYLVQGDLEKGFFHYDVRFSPGNQRKIKLPLGGVPIWNGESIEDKTLYVYDEQGNGDILVFARFLPLVKKLAKRVVFHSRAELEPFFNSNKDFFEGIEIINRDKNPQPQIRFDYQIPIMSLAYRLKTTLKSIPYTDNYLKASDSMIEKWANLVQKLTDKKIKVALTWSGNPDFGYDKYRSLQISDIEKLVRTHEDIAFFAVTKGKADEELKNNYKDLPLIRVATYLDSFDDTAGLLHHVDLVISVDTAVAHLGASMGKETWVLLYHFPFWIWGTKDKSPWYLHAKLYHQKTAFKWEELLNQVDTDLAQFNLEPKA